MESPKVSVILPVYNRQERVRKTIDSILNQTYKDYELIIIDNASSDNTVDEIKKFSDNRIKLFVNEKNMGQTYSINRGLDESRGEYIARIDSDDIAVPSRLEKQVRFLDANPEFVLCGSWVKFISDHDKLMEVVKMPISDDGLRTMQFLSCGMYHPTAMYRKKTLVEHHLSYDKTFTMAEDYDLWEKLLRYGRGLNLPEVLVYYRKGNSNDSKMHIDTMREEGYRIRERIIKKSNCAPKEKDIINEIIKLEKVQNKSLLQTIKLISEYFKFLSLRIKKLDADYNIIRQHIMIRIYANCIRSNIRLYARLFDKAYSCVRLIIRYCAQGC